MNMPRKSIIIGMVALMAVAGCAREGKDIQLTRIKNDGKGPDEFSVLPSKPLQAPESYSALPTPTPGGANLVDRNPEAEGIAALGGRAVTGTGIAASDGGLVNHTRRYGVSDNIRQTLASEDVDVRRRQGRVNILNIGPNDDYTNAYRRQWLDSQAEQRRLQARGIVTPAAPPPE